jgi:PhzF family phenazine biosynthesis protein
MTIPIFQVDAFTSEPFAGNPAAVCLLDGPVDATWMQNVAQEMNLSETAFVYEMEEGYSLRWFTPTTEVDLCGHATLASAHILWEEGKLDPREQARFHSRSGLLTAGRRGDKIELDFPATPAEPVHALDGLDAALGAHALYVGRSAFDYLVELDSARAVRDLAPDLVWLKELGVRGVMVTATGDEPGLDFVSRYFAPGAGIDEDPVTGSIHCCLGPYWGEMLGKTEMAAYQASARGGSLEVRLAGDRVKLGGQAVTVLRGELVSAKTF